MELIHVELVDVDSSLIGEDSMLTDVDYALIETL